MDGSFNYAANAEQGNAIAYAWFGMTGGFPGTYSMHPYYVKINEYNDMESRDLWEFPLKLSDDELHYVLAHLWEMSSVYFPYYYLDENCSYHVLSLIDAGAPRCATASATSTARLADMRAMSQPRFISSPRTRTRPRCAPEKRRQRPA